jgi:excisionase family DNA binding protein
MAGNEVLLDVGQVAEMLKISVATVRRWVLQGYIPYMKIGKAIRFSNSDIENWVSSKCTNSIVSKKQEGAQNVNIA